MRRHAFLIALALAAVPVLPSSLHKPGGGATEHDIAIQALDVHLAQAMSQNLLIDRHKAAGLACQPCHGDAFSEPVSVTTCIKCHGSYADLAAETPWEPNPHRSHMGELACSACHNIHKPSVSFCDQCHSFGMRVP